MSQAIPLVNSAQLAERQSEEVRLIGKVLKVSGDILLLEASDHGTVEVKLQVDDSPATQYVEVVGRVSRTGDSVTQHALLSMGDDIDLTLVEHLVHLTPKYPALFSE
ncbi:replication factor A3 [Malassezia restricta]|uniref:Replication factor A protein 3 n=1 Tax=Malassezia restricta (strain ATCC 96810 / NBRC 103918 / CBS 7877) TaxID=425264 RepID=A0A3G2S3W6_MALR7|nr:replication factor A3 [Malassezia restricta]AXA49100.1 replication factor A3 [Malassezia restricta]AYO41992.1 Replication factor A protein 3 [Malassezia restricta CBS 7877]